MEGVAPYIHKKTERIEGRVGGGGRREDAEHAARCPKARREGGEDLCRRITGEREERGRAGAL